MTQVIHKIILSARNANEIVTLPVNAEFLTVQNQKIGYYHHDLVLWYLFNTEDANDTTQFKFTIIGTGVPFEEEDIFGEYVGTAQVNDLVWHVFVEPVIYV